MDFTSFFCLQLRRSCRATRRLSLSSAYDLLCLPIMISSIFMMRRMNEWPSLNTPAAKYAAISIIFNPQCRCFRARRYTVALKLLFAFCVWPPKHLWSKSFLDRSSYIGRICFWTSGWQWGRMLKISTDGFFATCTSCRFPVGSPRVLDFHSWSTYDNK